MKVVHIQKEIPEHVLLWEKIKDRIGRKKVQNYYAKLNKIEAEATKKKKPK